MPNHRSRALFSAPWLALLAAAQDPAPSPPPAPAAAAAIRWEGEFDAALARAAAEKKPLFVAFLMDDEPANDETVKDHYRDPQIQKLLAHFVCLVGCLGEHRDADGGCAKFPGLACSEHRAVEQKARERWLVGDTVCAPQHVFCDPQGNVLRRKVYFIGKPELAKSLLATLADCGVDTSKLQVDFGKEAAGELAVDERARVTTWLQELDANNLDVREAALRGLGYADDPRALPAVLKYVDDKRDQITRTTAIRALARKGNYQAVAPLCALLRENKLPILVEVAGALEEIQMPEAVPPLLVAIKKEKRDRALGAMLRAAARLQPGNAELKDLCLKRLKTANNQLEDDVMIALGRLDSDDRIVDAVLPRLQNKTVNTRGLAVWVLGNQHSERSAKALAELKRDEKAPEVLKLLDQAIPRCRGETVEGYGGLFWKFLGKY